MIAKFNAATRLRGVLLALTFAAMLAVAPYLAMRALTGLVPAIDGRHESADAALEALPVYPHGGFSTLNPQDFGYEVRQRQVLRHPAGMLYALGWRDESGQSCIAVAFVEAMRDSFGGWKGRGAWGHCSALNLSSWVTGNGEFQGFSVANGLSGAAELVRVTWRNGERTTTRPVNGVYMSVSDRHGARAVRVDFFYSTGDRLHSLTPFG